LGLSRIFSFLQSPALDWIQVEVSSHCNAACIYCPNAVYREGAWQKRHLPLATFRKMLPAFARTRLVHLQGWGEPFLNPDFFEMVRLAKEAGCRVATTTNGMLLDGEKIKRLVQYGVDVVAFSLAGVDEKNDAVRRGTRLAGVLDAIRALSREKEKLGARQPAIHIAYMLLRSGLEDVERLPLFLQGLGVSQVVLTTLDFVSAGGLADEALRPSTVSEYDELRSRLDAVAAAGESCGLNICYQLVSPGQRCQNCTENVLRAVVVSSDGSASPCVFANLPVSQASFIAGGAKRPYQRLIFGNVGEQPLKDIWREPAYAAFRRSFHTGQLAAICRDCPKIYTTEHTVETKTVGMLSEEALLMLR
jgi:MoaA/NifB/PqqE/SkfB family radical SAM enzyme